MADSFKIKNPFPIKDPFPKKKETGPPGGYPKPGQRPTKAQGDWCEKKLGPGFSKDFRDKSCR